MYFWFAHIDNGNWPGFGKGSDSDELVCLLGNAINAFHMRSHVISCQVCFGGSCAPDAFSGNSGTQTAAIKTFSPCSFLFKLHQQSLTLCKFKTPRIITIVNQIQFHNVTWMCPSSWMSLSVPSILWDFRPRWGRWPRRIRTCGWKRFLVRSASTGPRSHWESWANITGWAIEHI